MSDSRGSKMRKMRKFSERLPRLLYLVIEIVHIDIC